MSIRYETEGITIFADEFVIKKIELLCKAERELETGGIIIGYYSADHSSAIVCDVTGAPSDSKSGRSSFFRGIKGFRTFLLKLWNTGKYYLGEWHYHPNCSPTPSGIDNQQMIQISKDKKYACPEPILIIIGGRVDFFMYSVSVYKNGQRIELSNKTT